MTLLEKCSEIRGEIRKCLVYGKLKGGGEFTGGRHKTCIDCKCASLGRKRDVRGRPGKAMREEPVKTEPVTMVKQQPVYETAKEPPRPTGRPPLLRIPKREGLPPRCV